VVGGGRGIAMKAESSMGSAEYAEDEAMIAIEAIIAHVLIGFTRALELAVAGPTRLCLDLPPCPAARCDRRSNRSIQFL
jgi:hypothetical protein